jgi:hypothetical protein
MGMRLMFRRPPAEDWQKKFGFATLQSLNSSSSYTVERELKISDLRLQTETISFKMWGEVRTI